MNPGDHHKSIIHLDMDAFYPSVEVLDNPNLEGKPVIVGGSMKRGVVSSASYEARRFGVHSAQPMATAVRRCPQAVFLPVRMARYKTVSKKIFEIFHRYTPLVETLSIDEAFLDVTASRRLFGDAAHIAQAIKATTKQETGLTVSAGVAPSKFLAKIASDMDKPDGLTVVSPDRIREFLDPLPVSRMWGVGKVTQKALARLNISTFKELRSTPVDVLIKALGKNGQRIHQLTMGLDEREVVVAHETKSIGHEKTVMTDITDVDASKKVLLALAEKVSRRLRQSGVTGKTLSLKVKYSNFKQITRADTLNKPTDDGLEIYQTACRLLKKTETGKRPLRLLGISLSGLSPPDAGAQQGLFDRKTSRLDKRRINLAMDHIVEKHGTKGVSRGTLFSDR
ncbi:MAG: DNA polymerase IV [Deltaproteobacteria bacterium]|nr:DNA polymerase IV [Deltaproteobacteria bacterium]